MILAQDYKALARKKQTEMRVSSLNAAREEVLRDLDKLGVKWVDGEISKGGRVDRETLEKEINVIDKLMVQTAEEMLQQQVKDMLAQAREGSSYVALRRRLQKEEDLLQKKDLSELRDEQLVYQKKQLEIFDYLEKHFAQFDTLEIKVSLPEAGEKFFAKVVDEVKLQMRQVVKKGRDLQSLLGQQAKKLDKLKRQEQREAERIHLEIRKNLGENEVGSQVLIDENKAYQKLLEEIHMAQLLKTSLSNQVNTLIDLGMEELENFIKVLQTIIGQNQATREILYRLKDEMSWWEVEKLKGKIAEAIGDFDQKVVKMLHEEIDKRYGEGIMSEEMVNDFADLMEQVLDFQEYLGQIMLDTKQVMVSNFDDLWMARQNYGRLVLGFFAEEE